MATVYNSLNLHAVFDKTSTIVSTEEALKDVAPIEWKKEILQGEDKILIMKKKE